jgi:hypothetical protein
MQSEQCHFCHRIVYLGDLDHDGRCVNCPAELPFTPEPPLDEPRRAEPSAGAAPRPGATRSTTPGVSTPGVPLAGDNAGPGPAADTS